MEETMNLEYLAGGLIALFLMFYLIYALLWPERF
jgi:K+-transporting ATPase KdpF subunit